MNLLLTYYYEIRYRLLRWYWNIRSKNSIINGVVLMYHHVSDERVDTLDSCQHTIEQFKHSLDLYLKQGYTFVNVQTALKLIEQRSSQKFAVVTFDDVPLDAYENAVPILKQMQIPFTFFITTSFLGTQGFMTEEQLKILDKIELCTIGAHTINHPMLRRVSNSIEELKGSKAYLEGLLGHPVKYFAYPYGRPSSVSLRIRQQAKSVGFECAFSTIDAHINDISSTAKYNLPRIVKK